MQQLVNIFGAAAETVAADAKPNEHIGSCRLPLASFSYSCKHEMALTLDDLMRRRSSLYFTEVDRGAGCCREIAEYVAPLLGWDRDDIEAQVNAYLEIIKAS